MFKIDDEYDWEEKFYNRWFGKCLPIFFKYDRRTSESYAVYKEPKYVAEFPKDIDPK